MDGEKRRAQVLECAVEAFAERGYHQTSVADIVGRAGIARGTFYQYFQDKRSIFNEALELCMRELTARIAPIDPSVSPEQGLALVRGNVRAVLDLVLERRHLARILSSAAVGLDPDFDRKLLGFYDRVRLLIERGLMHGQAMGLVRPCDIHLASLFIVGAIKELIYQVTMADYHPDLDTLVEEFLPHVATGVFLPNE